MMQQMKLPMSSIASRKRTDLLQFYISQLVVTLLDSTTANLFTDYSVCLVAVLVFGVMLLSKVVFSLN